MFDVTDTSRPASPTEAAAAPDEGVWSHEVVEETYTDREAAYLDNVDRIYRLVYTGVGSPPDAEDLTAEVFRAALGQFRPNSPKEEVRANLLASARILLASHWRHEMAQPAMFVDSDTDIAVRDQSSAPDDRLVGRNPHATVSDLRLLKYMSERDATLAAGVSQGSGSALQHRALFVAAHLAVGNK